MTDATSGDTTRSGSTAAAAGGAKGPDELRQQIEETRGRLGDTVEELAGRVDVKGRAKARVADFRDRAGAMTVQLRSTAAQAGHTVQEKAARAGHAVEHGTPGPVRNAVQAGLRHPRPVLVVGAAAGAMVAAGMLRRRHNGHR
ncbi:alanine-rich protein [Streptomyces fumigatiscleroticus]|nr:alanine-rich protein [Streptomyces fumigatiscleroticus]